jgi:hypothetical protein
MAVSGHVGDHCASTDLSIREIPRKIAGRASCGIIGEITKRARTAQPAAL